MGVLEEEPSDDSLIYQELKSLSQEIRRHDDLYYTQSTPELTDDEYDALVRREAELCVSYPTVRQQIETDFPSLLRFNNRVGIDDNAPVEEEAGPTTTPGAEKLQHLVPMLSLDNVHTEDELVQWLTRMQRKLNSTAATEATDPTTTTPNATTAMVLTEPKLDGLSLSIRYQRQEDDDDNSSTYKFHWAATRGDGKQGQDVTQAVLDMGSIPMSLVLDTEGGGSPSIVEIRGEVVLPTSTFDQLTKDETAFSNARNAASGILQRKKVANHALRKDLRFYAYNMVTDNDDDDKEYIHVDALQMRSFLASSGFSLPEPHVFTEISFLAANSTTNDAWGIQPLVDYHEALLRHKEGKDKKNKKYAMLESPDYDLDGAVHKVVDMDMRRQLGASTRYPRWAVAHKFPTTTSLTSLLEIRVQVGRTGALTPVAQLEPVNIAGVTVQRATLHNFKHLQQTLGNGGTETRIPKGSKVLVRRAGEVIPQVMQRVDLGDAATTTTKEWISLEMPTHCPACGSPVVMDDVDQARKNNTSGQVLRCGGPTLLCQPRAVGLIVHAFSRDALDILGFSEARIQQVMDAELLKIPSDLFKLIDDDEEMAAALEALPGWGPKSVGNLQSTVQQVADRGISLGRFIYSLGIRHAGQTSSELIGAAYGNVQAFLAALDDAQQQPNSTMAFPDLQVETDETKGIGPVLLASLWSFAQEEELVRAAHSLASVVPVAVQKEDDNDDVSEQAEEKPWNGWTVVFTGTIADMPRKEAQARAKRVLGAKSTPSSVSKSTNLVVVGERGGKKADEARQLGIPIMEAGEFAKLVEKQ